MRTTHVRFCGSRGGKLPRLPDMVTARAAGPTPPRRWLGVTAAGEAVRSRGDRRRLAGRPVRGEHGRGAHPER
jgi:hypothetical protein